MGELLVLVLAIIATAIYILSKISGKTKDIEKDGFIMGSAWFIFFIVGIFISMFLLYLLLPHIKSLENPIRMIVQIISGLGCIYLPYKIACALVPSQDTKDKEVD